jgi:uncharacterized protein (TIGR03437 family)
VNFMSLYELDPGSTDDLVQTVYFPEILLNPTCGTWECASQASNWFPPTAYDSPPAPAKIYAEVAMLINSATFIDNTRGCSVRGLRADTVSAASFARGSVAPESIVSVFGGGLATGTVTSTTLPLPTRAGGSTVTILDSAGVSRLAPIFYASPGQMNVQVPAGTAQGAARAVITREDGITSESSLTIAATSPGVFTANSGGSGVPAALAVRVAADGTQTPVPVFQCGATAETCVPAPVNLGADTDQLIVSLFGTGIRFRSSLEAVQVQVGGERADVLYAGAQGQFIGLDQINLRVPRTLRGRGTVNLVLSVAGVAANTVTLNVQ